MKNKKFFIIALVLVALAGFVVLMPKSRQQPAMPGETQEENQQAPSVTLTIDNGEHVSTFSGIQASTAFEALTQAAKDHDIPLVTKQYDFGVFVDAIGEKASTADRAWIYFVNGKAATVAADTQALQDDDVVSWRYIPPSNE
jgi:biopolymer transport protein ExbD